MLISPEYVELNRELHSRGNYGTSGQHWSGAVHAVAMKYQARTVLDYGCGQGTLGNALRATLGDDLGYELIEYDPAVDGKTDKPESADMVVCGDVLEHVEPQFLFDVLDDIWRIARSVVFLVIATRPAKKVLADGRNAHLIVEPADLWIPMLLKRWTVRDMRVQPGHMVMVGEKK